MKINFKKLLILLLISNTQGVSWALVGATSLRDREIPQFGQITSLNQWGCGATLVAPQVVITAAHCVNNNPGKLTFEAPLKRSLNFQRRF